MHARPAGSLTRRSRIRLLGWFAAAALVAIALLPGTSVESVFASAGTPAPIAAGNPQVDADPTPTPTPSPTPSPTPTPEATPTPSPTPRPFEPVIRVRKVIDADGILEPMGFKELQADQKVVDGWEFVFATDATITSSSENEWNVRYGPEAASVTLTEVTQEGFELLDAKCFVLLNGDHTVGELNGTSLTFELHNNPDEFDGDYTCWFFNTPTSSPGGDTATPPSNTLPPTDTGGPTSSPNLGRPSATLVFLAAILAAVLISIGPLRNLYAQTTTTDDAR